MENTNTPTTVEQHDDLNGAGSNLTPSCSFQNAEHAAIAYAKAGLSVLPLKADKTPAISSWTDLKSRIPTSDDITRWYESCPSGVGIVCGSISGNVECIDVDEKNNVDAIPLFDRLCSLVEAQASGLLSRLVHETSVNGGHHLVYRCSAVSGSMKLAQREPTETEMNGHPKLKSIVLIETRGEGAYFACSPTPGYHVLNGNFIAVGEITPDERNLLLECARALNRYTKEERFHTGLPKKRMVSIVRPGDDFNLRGDISPVLREAGWTHVFSRGTTQYWRRPGKKDGISASFNNQPDMFYVFSSNADPLEAETWYTKFAVLGLLKYEGDAVAAAKDLAEQGYGQTVVAAAESFLSQHYDFRFNEVTGRVEFRRKGEKMFAVLQEFDLNSIYRKLRYAHIEIGLNHLASLLSSEFSSRIDPFKDYFASLPPWDRSTDHIGELASTVTLRNPAHAETFRIYLRKWMVAAIGCAIDPDTVNHSCLVLVGPQGRYKTTWLNMLVPKQLSNYVRVGTIDPSDKDTEIHLSECFLINLDELETLNKHELGTLKSIMTYKTSRLRRPYAHFPETLVRRASFAGSINRDSFLTDETGTRRFLVVEVESVNTDHGIEMDKVYAQAYHLLRSGYRHWFDRDEIVEVNERNREFSVQSTEDELVAQYCVTPSANGEWLTATQVANRISLATTYRLAKSSARDFGFALKKAGYASKKLDGLTRYAVDVASGIPFHSTSSGVKSGVGSGEADSGDIDCQRI